MRFIWQSARRQHKLTGEWRVAQVRAGNVTSSLPAEMPTGKWRNIAP